ncbi:probable arabinosyltransferase ARAD1 [Impatiens glandulifera]|uniref:probable arabinosyltransferase ARAD1 n=1 Tax=Impatiens glandulifera TaxID=253017 RepID=UPI001FB061F3|nr:probable arabinosyltransferase ARAD1 [Impatiens glandulifera]XP_047336268.1 probable arabinosyltransferase ARAD1 [Impatiens glandulifera]XP_047336269.1 probable arabinosyltransferase ARAD1 [Impatiens glandulifera]XP_047336270.1 probable arabinosyltransferase ARAD1 [Impatiens glandulifera]
MNKRQPQSRSTPNFQHYLASASAASAVSVSASSASASSSPPSPSLSSNVKSLIMSSKIGRKTILKPAVAAILLFLACYASFNAFFYPNLINVNSNFSLYTKNKIPGLHDIQSPPVKVYMYNLPRQFTYGVIESYASVRNVSLNKYPGNQHPAEWYLFADLNRTDRSASLIERVFDPDKADLFYVPFFSSLSLVVNPLRPGVNPLLPGGSASGTTMYSDEEAQEGLIKWLEEQFYWKRNNGWDHIFICQDPNALYKVVDRVKNGLLLVSDFGRLANHQASLVKDVILPYSHRIRTFNGDVGVESRKSLLFFMGNRYRKEGGIVRDLLFQVLQKEEDVIIKHGTQSRESRRMASQGMHTSKFCLHPAGDTPSACRLFDAIVSLCIPVIVSDYIELPFEDVIDYWKIAIFVDSNTAVKPRYLVKLLREVSIERILEYQQEIKKVKHYFEYEDPNGAVKEIWRQVSQKLPLIKLMINRDKRKVERELPGLDCACLCSNRTTRLETIPLPGGGKIMN